MKVELRVMAFALILLGGLSWAQVSHAAQCEVLTIRASNTDSGIDESLKVHAAVLRQAPFSAYSAFQLVEKRSYDLAIGTPAALNLPAPFVGSLRLNSESGGQLDLTLTIGRQGKKPISVNGRASPGAPFFTGGFASSTGVLIFGVVCDRSGIVAH